MEKLKRPYKDVLDRFNKQRETISRLWNIGIETAELLTMLVMIKKPKIILELGTSNGFSTFHLALTGDTKIYTIDVENARQDLAKDNLQGFDNIIFISERIEDYLPKINYKIDLLFIDANKTNYLKYLQMLENHLSDGALVIADNISSHLENTTNYADYVRNSILYTTINLNIDAGLLVSVFRYEV